MPLELAEQSCLQVLWLSANNDIKLKTLQSMIKLNIAREQAVVTLTTLSEITPADRRWQIDRVLNSLGLQAHNGCVA